MEENKQKNIENKDPQLVEKKPETKRKPWLAGLLNFFLPGLGNIYAGFLKRGIIIFLLVQIYLLFFWILIVKLSGEQGLLFLIILSLLVLLLTVLVILDGVRCARKQPKSYILKPYNRWYYYLIIYFALYYFNPIEAISDRMSEAFRIPTGSMENTIIVGDYLIVDKMYYGIRNPFGDNYLVWFGEPERGDPVVYRNFSEKDDDIYEEHLNIHRCMAIAGDTIQIIKSQVYINGSASYNPKEAMLDSYTVAPGVKNFNTFPGKNWNADNYGPLAVPKKGDILKIDEDNYKHWKKFIYLDRGLDLNQKTAPETIIEEYVPGGDYTVQKDYIFAMGDNRDNSLDSRFTGFIPYDDVIGKAKMIYFSMSDNIYSIRFNRIGKKLE